MSALTTFFYDLGTACAHCTVCPIAPAPTVLENKINVLTTVDDGRLEICNACLVALAPANQWGNPATCEHTLDFTIELGDNFENLMMHDVLVTNDCGLA